MAARRRGASLAAALALAAGGSGAQVVTAPSLDAALGRAAPACVAPPGGWPEGRFWLRRGAQGLSVLAEPGAAPEALAYWTEAALGAERAAAALRSGATPDLSLMIESAGGSVALFDGRSTAALDPCAALDRLAAALGGAAPGDAAMGAAAAAAPPAAAGAETPVALRVGEAATVVIDGAPPAEAYRIAGPDGVSGEILAVEGGAAGAAVAARVTARVTAGAGAAASGALRLYAAADPFRPLAERPVTVSGGAAPAPAPAGGTLAPGARLAGAMAPGGAVEARVAIAAAGRYRFRSEGGVDLRARLIGPDGAEIAQDDDGGAGYAFSVSARLEPGEHRLVVSHCCGGGGVFEIVAESD